MAADDLEVLLFPESVLEGILKSEAAWGYLQAGVSDVKSPAEYTDYGRKHLTRFLEAAEKVSIL